MELYGVGRLARRNARVCQENAESFKNSDATRPIIVCDSQCHVSHLALGKLTSTRGTARDSVLKVDRILMSTDDDCLGALSRDSGDDARLSPSMRKGCDVDAGSATRRDDGLNLSQQPLGGLLSVRRSVVSILECREAGERRLHSRLAQFGQESIHSGCLRDSGGETGDLTLRDRFIIQICDVDEVFMFLQWLDKYWKSVE